jgi:hypothetical protein
MSAFLGKLLEKQDQNVKLIIATSVITTIAVLSLRSLEFPTAPAKKTIACPRHTQLPRLSVKEQDGLPYPPDAFPSVRDVASPVSQV